jgi:hypothetical protein
MDETSNLKLFKENLLRIHISYFGENTILLNNMVKLSDGIITSLDDLTTLVVIITGHSKDQVLITVKEIESKNCCLRVCKALPLYRRVEGITINKRSFISGFPDLYKKMEMEFNISLNYVMI